MKLFTIGFTRKSAAEFFTRLEKAGVKKVVDIRLNNTSQLAGFAKKEDLKYFLEAIAGISYLEVPELAPTQEILDAFKKSKGKWSEYEERYLKLIADRKVEEILTPEELDQACLLCSEDTPEHCHRRLAAEHLQKNWGNLEVCHL